LLTEAEIIEIIDNRLKFLGIFPELVEGDGSWLRAKWAEIGLPSDTVLPTLSPGSSNEK
jgi:hypothetical protein